MCEVIFRLNNIDIRFHLDHDILFKIKNHTVFNDLFNNHCYSIKLSVETNTFNIFLMYLQGGEMPTINANNYWEIKQLSNEFGFMKNELQSEEFKQFSNYHNLFELLNNQNVNKSSIEKLIAQELDICLTNFQNELQNIEFESLYKIFNHKERILNDHDKAYQFIINLSETQSNNDYYAFLTMLDAKKLNEINLRDSFMKKEEHFGNCPKNIEHFINILDQEHFINFIKSYIEKK